MSDRLLAEALLARDPSALASVYAAYSHQLYAYCWFRLSSREAAETALRDTLVVAEAHIGRLRDRDRLGPWLYAIARLESGRSMAYGVRRPDIPVARHDQEDVDLRIAAWRAVMALPPLSREVLELRIRHLLPLPDLAAVLGLPARRVESLLDQARADLEAALTAEVLAREGPYDCPGRAEILRERRAELTADLRDRLLRHALACPLCGAHHPGTVSAVKVYGLLPVVSPPDSLRLRVMSCFLEPDLIRYRFLVAVRAGRFDQEGFPVQPQRGPLWRRQGARGAVPRRPAGTRAAARGRLRVGRRDGALLGAAAVLMATGATVSFVPLFRGSGTGAAPPAAAHPAPALGPRPERRRPWGPVRGEALIVPEPVTVSLRSGDPAVWPLVMMSAPTAGPARGPRTPPPWTTPTRNPPSPAPSTPSQTSTPSHPPTPPRTGPPPSGGPGTKPPSPAPSTKPPCPTPTTRPPSPPPPASPSPPATGSPPPSEPARTAGDPSAPGP
jgi:DNA-directed RNA polymerase specialized sigma24 family protein